jgi:diguanylate cyclase (GGDEF)-like protein
MKYNSHSEDIKKKLFWSIVIIIGSISLISIPLTFNSYQAYGKAKSALTEISVLNQLTDLSNLVSKERAPTNNAMSSTPEHLDENLKTLELNRQYLDQKISDTIISLRENNYPYLANKLEHDLKITLAEGRDAVDEYIALPQSKRSAAKLDHAIQKMYVAWNSIRSILESFMMDSVDKTTTISNNYTIILLLTDLRDQAGRVASNIIAPLNFKEKISDDSVARSLQTKYQANYLWELINTIQSEQLKTPKYLELHWQVKEEFIDKGIPLVLALIDQSQHKVPYSMTAVELTESMISKYATVVNLQHYIIESSIATVRHESQEAFRQLLFSIAVSIISWIAALFTLIYARNKIFAPLIEARQKILMLANSNSKDGAYQEYNETSISLFEAIQKLQCKLQQRDILEFQLHNIANTDALTGVSNRLALYKYVQMLEGHIEKLSNTGLIVLDIDNFKKVNDTYGHIIGDQVIQFIASKLKANLRASDIIVRYGGDEFIVILDSIEAKDILQIAEKIRRDISESEFVLTDSDQVIRISVSAGVAVGEKTWKELFDRADKSLLKVKVSGKNAVSE